MGWFSGSTTSRSTDKINRPLVPWPSTSSCLIATEWLLKGWPSQLASWKGQMAKQGVPTMSPLLLGSKSFPRNTPNKFPCRFSWSVVSPLVFWAERESWATRTQLVFGWDQSQPTAFPNIQSGCHWHGWRAGWILDKQLVEPGSPNFYDQHV